MFKKIPEQLRALRLLKGILDSMILNYEPLFKRFIRFFGIGFTALLIDISLAWALTHYFALNQLFAICIAFLTCVSLSYFPMRMYSFFDTKRPIASGYLYFLSIALFGLIISVGGSYVLSSFLGIHPLLARFFVGGITGMFNFLMNTFFNFKVS